MSKPTRSPRRDSSVSVGFVRRMPIYAVPLLLLACTSCACFTRQDPADAPYRTGTIERFDDGAVSKGQLLAETEVGGYRCTGWVRFHENGALRSGRIASDHTVQGHRLPGGTTLWLDAQGRLESCWLSEDTEIDGIPCDGGPGKVTTYFHPNGKVRDAFLARDFEIGGVPCKASGFAPARMHPNGRLAECVVTREIVLDGVRIASGARARFDEKGALQGAVENN